MSITENGYIPRTEAEIRAALLAEYSAYFPDSDLSIFGAEGALELLHQKTLKELFEILQYQYYSQFIDSAEGISLDRKAAEQGIRRRPDTSATVTIEFNGSEGTEIDESFVCSYPQRSILFSPAEAGTIGPEGVLSLTCRAVVPGFIGVLPANSITEINTPISGLDSVTNPDESTPGANRQTDTEFRAAIRSRGGYGTGSIPGQRSILRDLPGVTRVTIIDNPLDVPDLSGRPPHSVEYVIEGGSPAIIAAAIYFVCTGGIYRVGEQSFDVIDEDGQLQTMRWNVLESLLMFIYYDIEINLEWQNGIGEIVQNTVEFVGGTDANGTSWPGLGPGRAVHAWRCEAAQSNVLGIDQISAKVATITLLEDAGIASITEQGAGIWRVYFDGAPDLGAITENDLVRVIGADYSGNDGVFVAVAVGSDWIDVRNGQGATQTTAGGAAVVKQTETDDLMSIEIKQFAYTTYQSVGVQIT